VGVAAASVVDRLVVVGPGAAGIAEGALAGGLDPASVERVVDRAEALGALVAMLEDGDAVLVKASRGAALDLLVDQLVLAATPAGASA
jgi:UDP-N-acetylmuramoyl-tripeptide--D-alanyl-D-alanine ligase